MIPDVRSNNRKPAVRLVKRCYVLDHKDQTGLDKKALLGELTHFMGKVVEKVEVDMKKDEDAFGIWKTGDN